MTTPETLYDGPEPDLSAIRAYVTELKNALIGELIAERDEARAERDGYRQQLDADWQARQITDLMRMLGEVTGDRDRARDERDEARATAADRQEAWAAIQRVREYVGGDLTLTNAEMGDLADWCDDHHAECAQVWKRYFVRVVSAALDGGPS